MFFKKAFFVAVVLTCSSNLIPAILIKGDIDSTTKSFSFDLGPHIFSQAKRTLFVTAAEEKADNEFAVAFSGPNSDRFLAVAIPTVTLNGEKDQPDPITGAAIDHIDLMNNHPLVVKQNDADKVFYFNRIWLDPTKTKEPSLAKEEEKPSEAKESDNTSSSTYSRETDDATKDE